MKKISIVLLGLLLGSSLLQASSQEHQSMKCGASMDMKEKKIKEESSMKHSTPMNIKKKMEEKSSSKCGAQHMKMSAGKCGASN
jgi:uncharacterized low-complexity protein